METASIQSILLEHSPIRRGHFLLSSGMHSPHYVQLEPIVQDTNLVSAVSGAIAARFREQLLLDELDSSRRGQEQGALGIVLADDL